MRTTDSNGYVQSAYREIEFFLYCMLLLGWDHGRLGVTEIEFRVKETERYSECAVTFRIVTQGLSRGTSDIARNIQVEVKAGDMSSSFTSLVNVSVETWTTLIKVVRDAALGRVRIIRKDGFEPVGDGGAPRPLWTKYGT